MNISTVFQWYTNAKSGVYPNCVRIQAQAKLMKLINEIQNTRGHFSWYLGIVEF